MRRLPYILVLLLQIASFILNAMNLIGMGQVWFFQISVACYFVSLIFLWIGIIRGSKAGGFNCLATLLFILNMFYFMLYLFTTYLGSFVQSN